MSLKSLDPEILREVFKDKPAALPVKPEDWLASRNIMMVKDGSVGLFAHEYPGVYSGHWFFKARGRQALDLAKEMLDEFFKTTDAKAIRGLTPKSNKAACWAARQIGMKHYETLSYPHDGDYELFCMTKEEFYERSL